MELAIISMRNRNVWFRWPDMQFVHPPAEVDGGAGCSRVVAVVVHGRVERLRLARCGAAVSLQLGRVVGKWCVGGRRPLRGFWASPVSLVGFTSRLWSGGRAPAGETALGSVSSMALEWLVPLEVVRAELVAMLEFGC
ncbi:hypothetical protein QQ045_031927 [Rhodiola kirilowii]